MPPRRRAPRRKPARKGRKGNRKSRVPKHLTPSIPQYSKIVETIQVQDMESNQAYLRTFSLNDFNRARFESVNWRQFKAAKCTWTYEPLYNTYQDGNDNTALSAPYLYKMMNRVQDSGIANSLGELLGMGAMPQKLTRSIKFSYKPNWNIAGLSARTTNGTAINGLIDLGARPEYGWVNNSSVKQTQVSPTVRLPGALTPVQAGVLDSQGFETLIQFPSYCEYNGHSDYLEQKFAGTTPNQIVARLSLTVEWHFKGPAYNDQITQNYVGGPTT